MAPSERNPSEQPLLFPDPVIEAYIKDVDRTLLREMLKKTVEERVQILEAANKFAVEAMRAARSRNRVAGEKS
jgi:hypothetical protein